MFNDLVVGDGDERDHNLRRSLVVLKWWLNLSLNLEL